MPLLHEDCGSLRVYRGGKGKRKNRLCLTTSVTRHPISVMTPAIQLPPLTTSLSHSMPQPGYNNRWVICGWIQCRVTQMAGPKLLLSFTDGTAFLILVSPLILLVDHQPLSHLFMGPEQQFLTSRIIKLTRRCCARRHK